MEYSELIGKTIVSIKKKKLIGHDDNGYLEIKFKDGTKVVIVAYYGEYTGESEDEYPTGILISDYAIYRSKLENIK